MGSDEVDATFAAMVAALPELARLDDATLGAPDGPVAVVLPDPIVEALCAAIGRWAETTDTPVLYESAHPLEQLDAELRGTAAALAARRAEVAAGACDQLRSGRVADRDQVLCALSGARIRAIETGQHDVAELCGILIAGLCDD